MGGHSRSAEERLARIAEAQYLLADVSRSLGPALQLDATVKAALGAMRELVDFRGGSISLVEGDALRIAAADPPVSEEVATLRLPVGSGIAGRVVTELRTIYVPDLDDDARVDRQVRRTGSNAGMVSYLAVPLVCLGSVIGVLQVDSEHRDAFDDIDVMLLEGLATQTANAIESARQHEEQARLDGLKTGFINMVSHELRTPLTIAGGMVSAYRQLRTAEPDGDHTELLDRAEVALGRLERLIEELIMMSQLASGQFRVAQETVSVDRLLADVAARSQDPGLLRVEDAGGLTVVTDERMLGRALDALVENALVYAGDGELAARLTTTQSPMGTAEQFVVLEVRDHGPGIADDVVGHAEDTFARSRRNATTIAGLGLGLSMATALVTELDGELIIETTAGEGTTVRVELPVR